MAARAPLKELISNIARLHAAPSDNTTTSPKWLMELSVTWLRFIEEHTGQADTLDKTESEDPAPRAHFSEIPEQCSSSPDLLADYTVGEALSKTIYGEASKGLACRVSGIDCADAHVVQTQQAVALKRCEKARMSAGDLFENPHMEIDVLTQLSVPGHDNIVRLVDVMEDEHQLYIVLEFCAKGELFPHVRDRGPLSNDEALFYFRQLVSGVQYLHRHGFAHCDIRYGPFVKSLVWVTTEWYT